MTSEDNELDIDQAEKAGDQIFYVQLQRAKEISTQVDTQLSLHSSEEARSILQSFAPFVNLVDPDSNANNQDMITYSYTDWETPEVDWGGIHPPPAPLSYEAVSPLNANVPGCDQPNDQDVFFIPYADIPKFVGGHLRSYLSKEVDGIFKCRNLAWTSRKNPYDLSIKAEILRRCLNDPMISIPTIENMAENLATIESLGIVGPIRPLLKRMAGSEEYAWSGKSENPLGLIGIFANQLCPFGMQDDNDLENSRQPSHFLQHHQRPFQLFCSNRGCLTAKCQLHDLTKISLPDQRSPGLRPENKYKKKKKHGCSNSCFLVHDLTDLDEFPALKPREEEELDSYWRALPEESPCTIAVLCGIPCIQAYQGWGQVFHGFDGEDRLIAALETYLDAGGVSGFGAPQADYLDQCKNNNSELTTKTLPPCNHPGDCNASLNCLCRWGQRHCERNCSCPKDCPRRWQGCTCRKGQCRDPAICPCIQAGRECEINVCKCCTSGKKKAKLKGCTNAQSQTKEPVDIEVKRGEYGLGAFTTSRIKKHRFIGEYTGEIYPTSDLPLPLNDAVRTITGRNYSFAGIAPPDDMENVLDQSEVIESMYGGNGTRFLNHSTQANCMANLLRVNGVCKMLFFATEDIDKGDELLLDYGEAFFANDNGSS